MQARSSAGCYLIFRTGDYLLGDNLLADIAAELAMKEPFTDLILIALLHSFLLFLMRHFSTDILWFAGEGISPEERVMLYIRNHFRTITLGELERQFSDLRLVEGC